MSKSSFFCIDAHTCGNPVRVVAGGGPPLKGATMSEKRQAFLAEFDWIRTGLMFEPRGHDVMSGSILYPASRDDTDAGILFIETSGCLPMCGHGTIGTVTVMIEEGLVRPKQPGRLRLEVPAGIVEAEYEQDAAGHVVSVRIRNVASFLHAEKLAIDLPGFGPLVADVAYGGNFYAIVEPQPGYADLEDLSAGEIQRLSPIVRRLMNERYDFVHPDDPTISGLRHVQWTGRPKHPQAHARNAVFYGEKAIDRSPCGTGTSARMAQLAARGQLKTGDAFVHESIIGSLFHGRVEDTAKVGGHDAIIPSVAGQAWITGYNTIFLDDRDPFVKGFTVL
ncbi:MULTISPECIES: 4-hydroxyproline epimerase [unclassified Inquilinus]|uniref:4-hydroxyproline epimerase n=1 Tax=unclassified Inquilinus TaxID=2645927 RepID=UPI003F8FD46B